MADEWAATTLGAVLSFKNGRSSPDRADSLRYPVYGSNGVIGFSREANAASGTIVIGRVGSNCGSLYFSKEECWVTDNAIRAEALGGNDARFLFYLLSTLGLNHWRAGSGQPLLNQAILEAIPAAVPDSMEQRAIAHILGTLDDKIELNRRMSKTLEAIARALFKSWFVDFDPVRAKAEGRETGLPKEIEELFPDRLVTSEVGEVPEGWAIASLADFTSLNPETWSKNTRPPVIHYVDLSNTKWGRIDAVTAYGRQDAPSRAQRVLKAGDTIVGTVRPGNGSYAFIADEGLTGSTGFAVLRPLQPAHAEFVYFAATSRDNIETLSHLADGAAYPAVRPEVVAATPVVRPSDIVLQRFTSVAGPPLARMSECERESRTIAGLRNVLLPKLISGALRVSNRPAVDKRPRTRRVRL